MQDNIGVVDLFAGPGGLGEGFSSLTEAKGHRPFKIAMSVECEASAHRTLQLRAFFRQFNDEVPDLYYEYLRGVATREELFAAYPDEASAAVLETMGRPMALGDKEDDAAIYARIRGLRGEGQKPWVVIGGPPCQAYSLVGRSRNKGIKNYRAEKDRRHFLYEEYLRTLDELRPDVFVMENVKGLLSSQVGGGRVFGRLLEEIANPTKALGRKGKQSKYRVYSLVPGGEGEDSSTSPDYLVRSERFGVPQARHRVILLGVAERLGVTPRALVPAGAMVLVEQVLSSMPKIRSGLSKGGDSPERWRDVFERGSKIVRRSMGGSYEELDRIVSGAKRLTSRGQEFHPYRKNQRNSSELDKWLIDPRLGGFVQHESRGHIAEDIWRYMYCSFYASKNRGNSPRTRDFPDQLAADHKNWKSGNFADRFKVQAKGKPASTVTSHISKDGHYYIHYDPSQSRSLTVREAARLQTFPDNYFFEGTRTQQYVQVGNAVPPWLARQIAEIVYDVLSRA